MGLMRFVPPYIGPRAEGDEIPAALTRFVDRTGRRDADRALNTASDLMVGLVMVREAQFEADTPANAAALAERARDIVTQLQVAIGRLDDRAEGR